MMQHVLEMLSDACGPSFAPDTLFEGNRYLSNEKLRQWVAYLMLRRAGEVPGVPVGMIHMEIVKDCIDKDQVNALFAKARRTHPHLDRWLSERHVPHFDADALGHCPKGSFGKLVYENVVARNFDLDMSGHLPNETDMDFWMLRGLQTHDLEHILGGSQFNIVGEMLPHTMRYGFSFRHLPVELAALLSTPLYLLTISHLVSAMLHTPGAFSEVFGRIQKGWQIGQESGPYFFARFEDYLEMPLEEARQALGIRGVDDADTSAASQIVLKVPQAA
jgi:ubiquinone biosynthesis protein COQ4